MRVRMDRAFRQRVLARPSRRGPGRCSSGGSEGPATPLEGRHRELRVRHAIAVEKHMRIIQDAPKRIVQAMLDPPVVHRARTHVCHPGRPIPPSRDQRRAPDNSRGLTHGCRDRCDAIAEGGVRHVHCRVDPWPHELGKEGVAGNPRWDHGAPGGRRRHEPHLRGAAVGRHTSRRRRRHLPGMATFAGEPSDMGVRVRKV